MNLADLMQQGGWAMYPIYACSLLAVTVFVKKTLEFRALALFDTAWCGPVLERLQAGDLGEAARVCAQKSHPASRVIHAVVQVASRRPDRAEAEAQRQGSLEIQQLERSLGALSFIAQVAPLLGLLGTVVGMVELFMGLGGGAGGGVDASALSSGIWQALLTTAAGLMVAVPALAAYTYLTSVTDRFRLRLQDLVSQVLTALPAASSPATRPALLPLEAPGAVEVSHAV